MTEPIAIEPVIQKSIGDCAVACLAMLLGVPYSVVLSAIPSRSRKHLHSSTGVTLRQMTNVARRLGIITRWIDNANYSNTVGILHFRRVVGKKEDGHVAILMRGVIYNPGDGLLWTDMEAFCKTTGWEPQGVMIRIDTEEDEHGEESEARF